MVHPLAGKGVRPFTYGDYLEWPDDERWEIIDGEAFDMTPAPNTLHQEISRNLCLQIALFLEGKPCRMFNAPYDVLLPEGQETDEEVTTVVQPDILVVCDAGKITERGCRGAPDWIIEILSPSTAGKDQIRKRRKYEQHGVGEFWVVHPTDRTIAVYRLARRRYGSIEFFDDQAVIPVKTLPGLAIEARRVFPPQPPRVVRESPRAYAARR